MDDSTCSGGGLDKVINHVTEERDRYTPSGGRYRMRHVEVRTPDGSKWRGRSSNAMHVIKLRRISTPSIDEKGFLMTKQKRPEEYNLSDRAHLVLECADRGWLTHLDGVSCWSIEPGRGNGNRIVVTAATGQKLVRDALLELTSGVACRVTKYGRDVLAPRRREGWKLDAGVGRKPQLKRVPREPEERPAGRGSAVLRELLRLES